MERRVLDAPIKSSHRIVASNNRQDPVLNLLEHIRFPVGLVDFDDSGRLVDRGVVEVGMKELPSEGQPVNRFDLRLNAQIVIAGIVPTAAIEAGDVLPGLEFCQRRRALHVAIEMVVIHRSHEGIVDMRQAVPDPVLVIYPHVGHLHRQEIFDRGLPDIALEDPRANLERI